jgi:hypothetical protein
MQRGCYFPQGLSSAGGETIPGDKNEATRPCFSGHFQRPQAAEKPVNRGRFPKARQFDFHMVSYTKPYTTKAIRLSRKK